MRTQRDTTQQVSQKLEDGWWVSGTGGRLWWHSEDQALIAPVSPDELEAMERMRKAGAIERGTKPTRVAA